MTRLFPLVAVGSLLLAAGLIGFRGAWAELGLLALAALSLAAGRARARAVPAMHRAADPPPVETGPLMAACPEPVVLLDGRGRVVEANAPARAVLPGLRAGHPLALALRAPEVLDAVGAALVGLEPGEVEFGGRLATEPAFSVRIRRLPDGAAGAVVALFLRDLTAQRRSEAMRVDFVAHVSHELRTPLASILGFVETLQGPAREDRAARERFLEIMRGQAHRMTRLVDDLLQLSRVELRAHTPPSGRVDLAAAAGHAVEILGPLARDRDVELVLDAAGPVEVIGDRDELLRVCDNLLANAITYGGRGGRVEVAVGRADERQAELVVRDRGPGIAPEHLPRLTERFYRVDVAESRSPGGTGLGLAIVKHIVGRHRGRLLIESVPGEGAAFRVRLPVPPPEEDVTRLS